MPNLLYPASCFVVDGFLKMFGYTVALVGVGIYEFRPHSPTAYYFQSGFIVLSGACTKLTQDYCLLYRFILVANKPKLLKFVNHAAGAVCIQFIILLLGVGLGVGSWWTFFPYNRIPGYLALWADEVPPLPAFAPNAVMLCVDVYYNPATILFSETIAISFAVSEVLSILFAVGTFKALRNNSTRFSRKTYRMHVQFTALLVAQFVAPFVFMVGPVSDRLSINWIIEDQPKHRYSGICIGATSTTWGNRPCRSRLATSWSRWSPSTDQPTPYSRCCLSLHSGGI